MTMDRSTRSNRRSQPRPCLRPLLLAALAASLAACGVEEPYQSTDQLPSDRDTQSATAPVDAGRQADGSVAGTTGTLPLDERAAQSRGNDWTDATRADYDQAIADCRAMGEALQQDCIEQVELGFRAANANVQNPAQLEAETGLADDAQDSLDAQRQAAEGDD